MLFVQQQRRNLVWLYLDLGDGLSATVTALQLGSPFLADHDLVNGEVRNGLHHRVLLSLLEPHHGALSWQEHGTTAKFSLNRLALLPVSVRIIDAA